MRSLSTENRHVLYEMLHALVTDVPVQENGREMKGGSMMCTCNEDEKLP